MSCALAPALQLVLSQLQNVVTGCGVHGSLQSVCVDSHTNTPVILGHANASILFRYDDDRSNDD